MTLSVLADDVGDPFEIVDAGIMGIVLSPAEFGDDLEGVGWYTVNCCPN